MKKIKPLIYTLLLIPSLSFATVSEADCHTKGTGWDGNPHSCSGEVCISAYRIGFSTADVVQTNAYGGGYRCDQPRIVSTEEENGGRTTRVTRVCSTFYAKSPPGMNNAGKRGTVRCQLSATTWND